MFKNKKLEVKMVKDEEAPAETAKPNYPAMIESAGAVAMVLVGAYFLADTLRGVVTHVVVTKVK